MDHEAFDEELIAVATEAIKYVIHGLGTSILSWASSRKTRDGKQRFAIPDGEFGKCIFLNNVPIEELRSVLKTHKEFVKSRFGSGDGKEAYVDAGDLGASPEAYAKGDAGKTATGEGKVTAASLQKNGVNEDGVKKAAVQAGGVPVDSTGVITNGVSPCFKKTLHV